MKRDETEETVLDMAKKLQTYADAVHSPTHARIAALKTQVRRLADKMEKNHKELKQDILQISAVQVRGSGTTRKRSLDREGKGIPRAKLLSENPSAVSLLKVEEQQVPIATSIVHRRQYRTTRDAVIPIHKMIPAECRPQFAFTWRGVQYTWNRLPQGWKHSPTICHGLIQAALEKGEAPEHLQYIDDIIV
ncbi:hypothetical protein DUI87_13646 [Hirundo rustica rustica]|uniref:ribonuclease H n=1 Tax=Hirundo rustica rustica TaxID=333673 RepID=A0A3M0K9M5_HIRRU|nr:hypothetical protein DUI87_13646 [Hirundo rustica rustica]